MHRLFLVTVTLLFFAQTILAAVPETRQRPVTEKLHGETVIDPFRWLEGDAEGNLTAEVSAWTDAQNQYTRRVLDGLPGRQALEARIRELLETPAISAPSMHGKRYFYSRREGDQPQARHFVRKNVNGPERLLLDPEVIDPSGLTTVAWTYPDNRGHRMAFGLYSAGDENSVLYVLDVDSGDWLAEEIPGKVNFIRWLPDDSGFYYRRLEDLNDPYSGAVKFHRLGTHHRLDKTLFRQRELSLFYGDTGKSEAELEALATTWGPYGAVSKDGRWMAVTYWTGTDRMDLWVANLERWQRDGKLKLVPLSVGRNGRAGDLRFVGDKLYLQHSFEASNGVLSLIDLHKPAFEHWQPLVPQHREQVISSVAFSRDRIAVDYLDNAQTRIELFDYAGRSHGELVLPGIGSAGLVAAEDRNEAFLVFTSFNMPRSTYHLDLVQGKRSLWARPDVPVDPDAITVTQVWYPSVDGTRVSMFLVHKKGLRLDGSNPTILYGYGGFNIALTPTFTATLFPWFERGGVYAVANLRGGGEYGAAWHEAGMLASKQNVFDDFISAAQWLVKNDYTSPERLGIAGGSNGGLLTGAAITQRPDLFAAAISAVPLLDMLRYENFLMARYWVPEYGSAQSAEQFPFLKAYSPYHNVSEGVAYPAVLLTAGENDTRVHPLHARKMAALLQARTGSDPSRDPVLLWVDRDAGHGKGKPLALRVRDVADQRIFMMWQLGMLK